MSIYSSFLLCPFAHRDETTMAAAAGWRVEVDRVLCDGNEELYLSNWSLCTEGAAEVAEQLRGTSNAVQMLDLSNNKFGDGGARSVGELLRSNPRALEEVDLGDNDIGRDGVAALADALRVNTTVRQLYLDRNNGVDPQWGGSAADAGAGVDSLVAAIGVNTSLQMVDVTSMMGPNPHQATINAALADTQGRRAGREQFLADLPMTKSARKHD
jgi:Leucine Rich repeat